MRALQNDGCGPERAIIFGLVLAMHIADDAVINPARCYIDAANWKRAAE